MVVTVARTRADVRCTMKQHVCRKGSAAYSSDITTQDESISGLPPGQQCNRLRAPCKALQRRRQFRAARSPHTPSGFVRVAGGLGLRAGASERYPPSGELIGADIGAGLTEQLSRGVNLKWLAEYCGTSVAMIERSYGRFLAAGADHQLALLAGGEVAAGRKAAETG